MSSLQEALSKKAAPKPAAPAKQHAKRERNSYQAPSRVGTRKIGGDFSEETYKQFRLLAVEEDQTQNALLAEALNDLFLKYGKSPIAK